MLMLTFDNTSTYSQQKFKWVRGHYDTGGTRVINIHDFYKGVKLGNIIVKRKFGRYLLAILLND